MTLKNSRVCMRRAHAIREMYIWSIQGCTQQVFKSHSEKQAGFLLDVLGVAFLNTSEYFGMRGVRRSRIHGGEWIRIFGFLPSHTYFSVRMSSFGVGS